MFAHARSAPERLVAQWELQAAEDGLERDGRYWDAGWAWMPAQRR
jgi:hypothetical protein